MAITKSLSRPYEYREAHKWKCGTSLPLRISRFEDIANAASAEFASQWKALGLPFLNDDFVKLLRPSRSGHLISVMLPETSPSRVRGITLLLDLILAADGEIITVISSSVMDMDELTSFGDSIL